MINGVDTTPFSIDIYGRFISNSWNEEVEGRGQDFDVVVIGSGMYGAYCAAHIYNQSRLRSDQKKIFRPLKILVLEAGPFIFTQHQQNKLGTDLGKHFSEPGYNTEGNNFFGNYRNGPQHCRYR